MPNTAKQEAIRKAYGEYWEQVKDKVDEDGWIYGRFQYDYPDVLIDWEGYAEIRPKSLQGIENNNGWIRIESDEDLPSGDMDVFVLINSKIESDYYLVNHNNFKYFNWHECTHWQPIAKPEKPIY